MCSRIQKAIKSKGYHAGTSATSGGHDKPFCTTTITIIDNFKKALGDIDNQYISTSQFLQAILVIDKLSPINFSDKYCGKFLMCLTKFYFINQIAKMFL